MKANCIATKHLTLNITRCDLSKERLQKWHQFKPGEVLFLVLFIQSMLKGTQTQNETTSPKRTNFPIATPQSTNMVTLRKTFFWGDIHLQMVGFAIVMFVLGDVLPSTFLNPAAGCWKRPASTNIEWHFIQVWGKTLRHWRKMVVDWLIYYILYVCFFTLLVCMCLNIWNS